VEDYQNILKNSPTDCTDFTDLHRKISENPYNQYNQWANLTVLLRKGTPIAQYTNNPDY
jgi:hypothetical protein